MPNLIDLYFFSLLCNNFYANPIKTLPSTRNSSIVISIYRTPSWVSFRQAEEICRKCYDSMLGQHDKQVLPFLPLWIGLQREPSLASKSSHKNWFWLNGDNISHWPSFVHFHYYDTSYRSENREFGMLAFPHDWSLDDSQNCDEVFNEEDDGDNEKMWRSEMDLLALPLDFEYNNNKSNGRPDLAIHYSSLTCASRAKLRFMSYIACERPMSESCHFWNFTDDTCSQSPRFGCHNYVNLMFHRADNDTGN